MASKPPVGTVLDFTNPLLADLKSYLLFNEGSGTSLADLSGLGNDGTITDTNATWQTDDFGQELRLTRGNGKGFTVPYCLNPTQPFTAAALLDAEDVTNHNEFLCQLDGTGIGRSWLFFEAGDLRSFLGGVSTSLSGAATGFQFVAITYDGTNLTLYRKPLAGSLATATAVRASSAANGLHCWAQDKASNAARAFVGSFVVNSLTQRCLSGTEIGQIADDWLGGDWLTATPAFLSAWASQSTQVLSVY